MPYSDKDIFERATYKPLQRILDSDKVRKLESRLKIRRRGDGDTEDFEITEKQHLEESIWQPDIVAAIDGSKHEVPVENGFPSAEYGYITVASVLIFLNKIRELEKQEFINPVDFRKRKNTQQ